MTEISGYSFDAKRTVVLLNFPPDAREEELTIHFQKERNGGGDVDEIVLKEDGSVAFIIFDFPEDAENVVNYQHVIKDSKVQIQSFESWLTNKKQKQQKESSALHHQEDSQTADSSDASRTIYVSDIKDSSTDDAIKLFFQNKRRSCGGELCPGERGFKRISTSVARLTFFSLKDAKSVIKKTKERPLKLEGSELKVSTIHELTHDKSILLAKNLNPVTKKETFQNFIESTKNVDVFNVILGQDGKAVVVLKNEIGKWVVQF